MQALDDVSLIVYPGEIHAIVGENGAGKSTLMNILAGELQPDDGYIVFAGEPRTIPNPFVSQQMGISVVYQELALCPNLSIAENISFNQAAASSAWHFLSEPARLYRAGARRAGELRYRKPGLHTPVGQLSVAQQQLVEIAKAISGEVKLLILDEPNSALTQDETAHLFDVLRRLRDDGVGIIYVSHRLEEVLRLADRITVLRDGKLIETLDAAHGHGRWADYPDGGPRDRHALSSGNAAAVSDKVVLRPRGYRQRHRRSRAYHWWCRKARS